VPQVSTKEDVDMVLGKPVPIMIDGFGWIGGHDYDPNWKIVVFYVGKDDGRPRSLVGRLGSVCLWPKRRISLNGVAFPPVFEKSGLRDERGVDFTVYGDGLGLSYSVYDHDSRDGRIHAGDLSQISYSASKALAGG
jgi:hypothetical protein